MNETVHFSFRYSKSDIVRAMRSHYRIMSDTVTNS